LATLTYHNSNGKLTSRAAQFNVTSESALTGGLFGCDLDQINEMSNKNGTFLDLVFTNVPVDMVVDGAQAYQAYQAHLLKLDRHHKVYEIEMEICC
jgi:hypothetical protein